MSRKKDLRRDSALPVKTLDADPVNVCEGNGIELPAYLQRQLRKTTDIHNRIKLIDGPPDCNKSRLLSLSAFAHIASEKKVLVVASSNTPLNNLSGSHLGLGKTSKTR